MDEFFAALDQAYEDYRQDLKEYEKKRKPTDGLLGFGRPLQNDPCHERFDERIKQIVDEICASMPSSPEAERAIRRLLPQPGERDWPLASQWMLRAIQRHILPLVPFLTGRAAAALGKEYAVLYRRWDRLPVQKEILKALLQQAKSS